MSEVINTLEVFRFKVLMESVKLKCERYINEHTFYNEEQAKQEIKEEVLNELMWEVDNDLLEHLIRTVLRITRIDKTR